MSSRRVALVGPVLVALAALGLVGIPALGWAHTSTGVRCTIVGTSGNDVLVGTPGRDVICGKGGNDVIRAGAGGDLVDGGAGRDHISGGTGGDQLLGGAGNDVLASGHGADRVDGGPGRNLCIVDSHDRSRRCRYDEHPPRVLAATVSPGSIDVTQAGAEVTVRAHVTDDTGVASVWLYLGDGQNNGVWLGGPLGTTSGSLRNGWWKGTLTVPRYTAAGPLNAYVHVIDRHGRSTDATVEDVLQVSDQDPDTTAPDISIDAIKPSSIDVRKAAQVVKVALSATDALSGVAKDQFEVCLRRPGTPSPEDPQPFFEWVACTTQLTRTGGTLGDGQWSARIRIPKGSVTGTYNVSVDARDRVGNSKYWMGTDEYAVYAASGASGPEVGLLPGDTARVDVVGAPADKTPARVTAVTASKTRLDTLRTDAHTHIRVHARDAAGPGEGVTAVSAWLVTDGSLASDPQFTPVDLTRTSGTRTNGWWEGKLVVPQGTPPGTYHIVAAVVDRAHVTYYTDPTGPYADGIAGVALAGIPVITVVDSRP